MADDLPPHLLIFRHSFDDTDSAIELLRSSILMIGTGGLSNFQKVLIDKCIELRLHADFLDSCSIRSELGPTRMHPDMKPGALPISVLESALADLKNEFIKAVDTGFLMDQESHRDRAGRLQMLRIPPKGSHSGGVQLNRPTPTFSDPADQMGPFSDDAGAGAWETYFSGPE